MLKADCWKPMGPSKLRDETQVVSEEEADVVDPVAEHRHPLDP